VTLILKKVFKTAILLFWRAKISAIIKNFVIAAEFLDLKIKKF